MSKPFIPAELDDADLTASEFRIFCRIIRRESAKDGCYESIPNMAKGCRIGVAGVRKAIHSLAKKGIIRCETRGGQSTVFRSLPLSNLIGVTPINIDTPIKSTPTRSDTTPPVKSDRGTPIKSDRQRVSQEGDPKKCIPKGVDDIFHLNGDENGSKPKKKRSSLNLSQAYSMCPYPADQECQAAWDEYMDRRRQAKFSLTERSLSKVARDAKAMGEELATQALDRAAVKPWQSLVHPSELETKTNGHNGYEKESDRLEKIIQGEKEPQGDGWRDRTEKQWAELSTDRRRAIVTKMKECRELV